VFGIMKALETSSATISCEVVNFHTWGWIGNQKTCHSTGSTLINLRETTLSSGRDGSLTGLNFGNNKKIFLLPIKVSESFPNLVGIHAPGCWLMTISKENFRNLGKLRYLSVADNKIEKIPSDAFEDLTSLEWLFLDNNELKFLNGVAFSGLSKIKEVRLTSNKCINENFEGDTSIANMQSVVEENCGFDKMLLGLNEMETRNAKACEEFFSKLIEGQQNHKKLQEKLEENCQKDLSAEKIANLVKISRLEESSDQLEKQITFMKDAFDTLEGEYIKTCAAKTEELQSTVELKLHEIEELLADNQKKNEEIKSKDKKIENMQKIIDLLTHDFSELSQCT